MDEMGVVIELKGASALVRMAESGGCEGCASGGTCTLEKEGRVLEAVNIAGAKPGQHVVVEFPGGAFLRASFVVYMLPVAFLFAGAFLGGEYGPSVYPGISSDNWQAVGGVIFLVLSLGVLKVFDTVTKKRGIHSPVVSRIAE